MNLYQKILELDRRWIFLTVLLLTAVFYKILLPMPIKISPQTQSFYDTIEGLKSGEIVHLTADYSPSAVPELYPMHKATVRRLLEKDVKIVASNLWAVAVPLVERVFDEVCAELNARGIKKKYGEDFVNLGYKAGGDVVMTRLGTSFSETYPVDIKGTPVSQILLMQRIRNFNDIALMVNYSVGSPGIRQWIQQVQMRFKVKIVCGATGVMAPDLYAFYHSGQLKGLLAGLVGAAEYEALVNRPGTATAGMTIQSFVHLLIIFMIILGNVAFFLEKRSKRSGRV